MPPTGPITGGDIIYTKNYIYKKIDYTLIERNVSGRK